MIKSILIVIVVLIAGVLAFAFTKPDTFRVERRIDIKAPPEKVFALINDFRRWQAGSPWEKFDPSMQRSHNAAASGQGAACTWQGDGKAGAASMEIKQSVPPNKVLIQLDFTKPCASRNSTEFALTPQADGTRVTWVMNGPGAVRHQADAGIRQPRHDDRQGLRGWPCEPENGGRAVRHS